MMWGGRAEGAGNCRNHDVSDEGSLLTDWADGAGVLTIQLSKPRGEGIMVRMIHPLHLLLELPTTLPSALLTSSSVMSERSSGDEKPI